MPLSIVKFTFVYVNFTHIFDNFTMTTKQPIKASTRTRHEAIFNRFNALTEQCRADGRYSKLYLSNFYVQIADEMGYSDNYVCRIVCQLQKEQSNERR